MLPVEVFPIVRPVCPTLKSNPQLSKYIPAVQIANSGM
jgi:hypothetical protein